LDPFNDGLLLEDAGALAVDGQERLDGLQKPRTREALGLKGGATLPRGEVAHGEEGVLDLSVFFWSHRRLRSDDPFLSWARPIRRSGLSDFTEV
jgi:hypothetical protein